MADDFFVRFGGDYSDLKSAAEKSKSAVDSLTSVFDSLSDSMKKSGGESDGFVAKIVSGFEKITLGVGAAIVSITGALVGVGAQATAFGDSIRTAAGSFDQSLSSVGNVKAVADRAGLGLTDLGKSFSDLQKKARDGDADITNALKAIGVNAKDVANLSQDALAVRLAQAFSTAKDSANKTETAVKLFGQAAAEKLVPELDRGADHIRDLQAAANRAGVVIGPELSASLQGTSTMFAHFGDRMLELKQALQGSLLQTFAECKPAIDALIQLFTDVVGNIASLIEWFKNLEGAGQRGTQGFGLIGEGARAFSRAMIEATTWLEEFGVKAVQSLSGVGASLDGLGKVAEAFGRDIEAMATTSSTALYTAFHEAIAGVVAAFRDLGTAAKAALSFDTSGVSSAFAKLGADTDAVGTRIKAALTPDLLSQTNAAWAQMQTGAAGSARALDAVIAKLEAQKKAQLALIDAGGITGAPVAQTRSVGDPSVAEGRSASDNDRIQTALKEGQAQIQAAKDVEQQQKTLLDAGVNLYQKTEEEKSTSLRDALQDRLQDEKAAYEKMLQIDGLKPQQHQDILNKMAAADDAYAKDLLRLQIEAAQKTQRQWDAVTSSITGSINSQVDGIIAGTTKLRDAFRNILASMLGDAIKFCISWAAKHAEVIAENILGINSVVTTQITGEAAKTGAVEAGAAARVATEIGAAAASAAAMIANVLKTIAALAAQAFAGVTAFMSSFIGPAALGVAGGVESAVLAVGSALPAMDIGAYRLPSDMVAMVHRNELVMPAGPAEAFRTMLENGGTGGGGDTHNYGGFNFSVSGARDPRAVVGEISQNIRGVLGEIYKGRRLNPGFR